MTGTQELNRVERDRARAAARSRARHAAGSEIGVLPKVVDPERKEACRYDLKLFLQTYFPNSTGLAPFGPAHEDAIARIQQAFLHGGWFINCMPRGYAKSTIAENSLLWAALYGHKRFGVILAVTKDYASDAIDSIKSELQENDLLYEDFPEVCEPVRRIENKVQRCKGQTHLGKHTHMAWNKDIIVLPRIEGSDASECIIKAGCFESIRGARYKRADGRQERPDIILLDDIQTDKSAKSPTRVAEQISRLHSTIAMLSGHESELAMVINATVLADGDTVDQLADPKKYPEWQSLRIKMVPKMPEHLDDLWLKNYAEIRADYDPGDVAGQKEAQERATQYYLANQEVMDAGAEVSWEDIRLKPGEVSAIQHAMNLLIKLGPEAFDSECQNSPRRQLTAGVAVVSAAEVRNRTNGYGEYVLPSKTTAVVFHCDVHNYLLYYTVLGIQSDFTAGIVHYGTFPEQPHNYFTMASVKRKMQDVLGTATVEEAIVEGVKTVANRLCGRAWVTADGEQLSINTGLFDFGYHETEVAAGIRASDHQSVLMGARGVGITGAKRPMTEYDVSPKRARMAGPNPKRPRWFVPRKTTGGIPEIQFDTNYWKTLVANRLMQPRHTTSEWSFFGNHRTSHDFIATQLSSEEPNERGEWGNPRTGTENHYWDNLVGCAVAASFNKIFLPAQAAVQPVRPTPPPVKRSKPKRSGGGGRSFFITAR